jgi:adenylate cyclase
MTLRIVDPYNLRLTRELVFDAFQRAGPRPDSDVPVRVVDIDEASLARLGQWPWPRSDLARLVERLNDLGASAIAFDMVFPEPDRLSPSRLVEQSEVIEAFGGDRARGLASIVPDYDRSFAASLNGKPVILGFAAVPGTNDERPGIKAGLAFTGQDPRNALPSFSAVTRNLPELDTAARGVGAITVSPLDTHGVIRQLPLLWNGGARIYPSLVVETLRVMQNQSTLLVHSRNDPPFAVTSLRVGHYDIPATSSGELRVWFGSEKPDRIVPAWRVLEGDTTRDLRPLFEGHAVFVGTSATGLYDHRVTPLGETMPGVLVQAQALEQILAGEHLRRPDWADPLEWAWMLALAGLTTLVTVLCAPITALGYGGAMAAFTSIGAWIAFSRGGILLDPTSSCATGLFIFVAMISFRYFVSDRDRRFVRQAFARYVAPSYLAHIEKNPASLRLGGDEREMTILFVDIRDFTALSEKLSPTEVVEFLNTLFGRLSADILAEGGTIDKYIGDSIMAFWNAPLRVPDHAARGCRAALRIRATLNELNASDAFHFRRRTDPLPDVAIGIGLNTGPALVGNMGSESRFNYSVVGDAVNVASRVEGQAKPLAADALVAESVTQAASELAYLQVGALDLRGKREKEKLFILVGDTDTACTAEFTALKECHAALLANMKNPGIARPALAECERLSDRSFPFLRDFYRRLGEQVETAPPELRRFGAP